ncbi:MAG: flagellar hook-basal body complex protein FliE [Clostridiales Family XIII bacterium]|jgi:flagellar hook-basal body complex protein FliE|nr:flagellar hook-basal body complex protein FliE [Clostridiales Family XIII bacterium]
MFIVPINSSLDVGRINAAIKEIESVTGASHDETPVYNSDFRNIFEGLIGDVERTEAVAEQDAYLLSVGALEDPHTAMINAAKAELTLSTMVQIRNKVLDAYSEIMRISV